LAELVPGSAVATTALGAMCRLPIRLLWLALALLSTALAYTFIMHPMGRNMEIAKHILCSGNLDFVYAVSPDTGLVYATQAHSPDDAMSWERVVENTVLQFTGLHEYLQDSDDATSWLSDYWPQDTTAGIMFNSNCITDFDFVKTTSTSDVKSNARLSRCEDFSSQETNQDSLAVQAFLRDATGGLVDSCVAGEMEGLAGWYSMTRFRGLCPVTSGCSNVWLFFSHPHWGCPEDCHSDNKKNKSFTKVLHNASCMDDGTEPWRTKALVEYVSGFSDYVQQRTGFYDRLTSDSTSAMISSVISAYENATGRESNLTVAAVQESVFSGLTFERMAQGINELAPGLPIYNSDGVELSGCALWTDAMFEDIVDANLCSEDYHQSIAFLCPESCRCVMYWQKSCPLTCLSDLTKLTELA